MGNEPLTLQRPHCIAIHQCIGGNPRTRGDPSQIDTFGQPQPHQQRLMRPVARGERFLALDPVPVARQRRQPVFGLLAPEGRQLPTPPMRAGANTYIVAVAPIGQVVAALLAGAGMVRNLIGGNPRRCGLRAGLFEQVGAVIRINLGQLALRHQRGKARPRFDRQLIQRQMPRPERKRAGKLGFPVGKRLARPGIDQVEAHPPEMALRGIERGQPLGHVMRAPQKMERLIVQRLQPQRHAVHAGPRNIGKARRLDRGGVGLQRDLGIGLHLPVPPGRVDDRGHGFGGHQRRRAAAEKDRSQRPSAGQRRLMRQIGEQSVAPLLLVHAFADMAVEIAIRALRYAEGPVHIKRKRRRGSVCRRRRYRMVKVQGVSQNTAATSCANASARWLIACLASGSISPKVMSWPSGWNIAS